MINRIYGEVEKLIKKYKTRNPYEIADSLGIVVMRRDLARLKGFYTVENKTRYIVINKQLDEDFQRLVCSHELGHDCLHRHFAQYYSLRDYTLFNLNGKVEREANLFAADLMISDEDIIINTRWERHTYDQIACMLRVPEAIIRFKAYSVSKRGYDVHTPELVPSDFLKDG